MFNPKQCAYIIFAKMFEELGYHHSPQIPLLSDIDSFRAHVGIRNPLTSPEHIPTTSGIMGFSATRSSDAIGVSVTHDVKNLSPCSVLSL
jgi:hypothetical protein